MSEINFKTFLNRRILINLCKMPIEKKVLEVSPSGDYVKLENQNGHKEWLETKNIEVLEVLEEVIEGKPLDSILEKVATMPYSGTIPYIGGPTDPRTRITYTDKTA